MKKIVKKITEKYVTMSVFEKAMASIARSFSKMDERFDQQDKAFELLLKQMQTFTLESREHRQSMSSLMRADISQEKTIEDLQTRVERLEMQIK
ncbi:MAG: hypothetical protein WCG28_01455 [bacterium]